MERVLRFYIPKSWNNPGDFSLPRNCASVMKSHTHHSKYSQPPIKQKPTTIDLIIFKHSAHTKLCHLICSRSLSGSSKTPRVTHHPLSFHLINTRNKKIKPYIHPAFVFHLATPGTKRRTHLSDR